MHRRAGSGGRAHSMLALQIAARPVPLFRVFRPATGRTPKQLTLQELRARYSIGLLLQTTLSVQRSCVTVSAALRL